MSVDTAPAPAPRATATVAVPAWIARDPLHVVAAVLIAASVVWRATITTRGYLTADDFPLIAQADEAGLSLDHLFELYNNHLMPAGRLVLWVTHRLTGFDYWPYATLMIIGQLAVAVAFYRLLRLMLPATWALLVPLCLFLFCPLTLEISAWWAVGMNLLPMQLAMIMALAAQVRYIRTRRRRHLASLAGWVVFGLVFFEKSLLVVALVFLVTVCLYSPGGPVRAVVTAIRRWPLSWLVLTVISAAFLAGYLSLSTSSLREPTSSGEVGTFLQQFFGQSLSSGFLGGPWSWLDASDGPAVAAPTITAQRISWVLVLALVAVTLWLRRGVALRAWVLLLLYSSLSAGIIGATRLGSVFSGVAGLVPRYIGDVLVVAAICVGVALCGLRRDGDEGDEGGGKDEPAPAAVRAHPRPFAAALAAATVLLVGSSLYSGVDFGTDWASKQGRDYLNTARAGLDAAEPGTVFMDQPVPEAVVARLSAPWNMQSRFFSPLDEDPVFVTQARQLWVFDSSGKVRPAWVKGVKARPGPAPGCGYQVTGGQPVAVPLDGTVVEYWQAVRMAYLVDRDTTATFRISTGETKTFEVRRGLNAIFLLLYGGGSQVELTVADPEASFCTNEIEIGELVPQPIG
ncbi:hypothetical protein [Phytohabitans houttuyneae]|uniref:Glycosyltransferase RgtA/B/C/D-like domain-containing protein n=1 Tax=Phytohabitans houttuyneae TaxID=1076126 RepID=A0A6V8KJY3_9ACTN|nr:hypothetical protein [Phytohabitans houttuyneae]GFJ82469.1 hypothetical protein Phou_066490 [Phytohabitans houttuyneae]